MVPAIASRSSRIPADGVAERVPGLQQPHASAHRSRRARARLAGEEVTQVAVRALAPGAAASRSITWKGGTFARLATWNLSLTGPT